MKYIKDEQVFIEKKKKKKEKGKKHELTLYQTI
jgi:hypothetical protein